MNLMFYTGWLTSIRIKNRPMYAFLALAVLN